MKKDDVIEEIQKALDSTQADAKRAFEAVFEAMTSSLERGEEVRVPGFGVFSVRDTKPRKARNPQTGETIHVPASKRVSFRASKTLKDAVKP